MIYKKKSRKMDWILMEAECKKQHKGQSFRKKMEAHYTQKQRRLDPMNTLDHATVLLLDTQKSHKLGKPIRLQLGLRFGMAESRLAKASN